MPVEYKILRDEDPIAFQYRVSKDKDLIGTWQDVADICNRELGYEYEISVKNRSNKAAGRNTLTFLMKDLREKDFKKAEANFYDQLRSEGTQWAANMSLKAIKENTFFDENDEKEVFDIQRGLIDKFQAESDEYKEKYRLALVEVEELKKQLDGNDG